MGKQSSTFLFLILILLSSYSYATQPVRNAYTNVVVPVCGPSDPNPNCVGGLSNIGISTINAGNLNAVAFYSLPNQISGSSNIYNVGSNLGIGTTSPGQSLDVNGTTRTTNFSIGTVNYPTSSTVDNVLMGDGTNIVLTAVPGTPAQAGLTYNTISHSFSTSTFGTVNSGTAGLVAYYKFTGQSVSSNADIAFNGSNVGIGSLAPGQALDVDGTVRAIGLTMSGSSPSTGLVLTSLDTSGDATWSSVGGVSGWTITNTNDVYETHGGNVGIGTINPVYALDVVGGSISLPNNNGGQSYVLNLARNDTAHAIYSTGTGGNNTYFEEYNGNFHFYDTHTSVDHMTITNNNVGVGSTNPGQALDVQGTVRALGAVINGAANAICNGAACFGTNVGIGSTNPGQALDVYGVSDNVRFLGIGTTVPQELCRKSDGTVGYFNGAWAGVCN